MLYQSANRRALTKDRGANGAANQETVLAGEGVEIGRAGLGERTVDFTEYGWFPNVLPSHEREQDEE